ncbi:DNA-directed RNA polymerase subunit beta' [Colidextribacter sp. 210702-DFI.3.9]|uniref:DNA-directed RNA polymerase subunit beta' n=1 Tax=Flintibacter faecis TaxID=2763047 RepID=A0A8J6J256_9FIRM|nr:DNA-directed RNA polymerase subunit beta' [Flintibacter faecis]MBC5715762.1 DNA-directed RNA polymerase subunit beta' [Flintibacter faecis]MCB6500683.1 DNA-directed RNA polymerase subunit beta' [Colidextribacter sp. 210702-DFI.3.9]MCG4469730.1 DNA-directed RNA polymerase subunit beta' [Lawsonibacter sp. DFI.6.74]MCG4773445.1 DNA-directed RNA polymerase subunit beta' [Lawsonibacter sp. DFI.5.51]
MSYAEFDAIRIGIASPEQIREWSFGEVKRPETINYRTLKPERDGLFCEKIFGPTKDWECNCGKYKKIRYKGKICDRCGVEITKAKVRRERMGHIELAAPVSHIWYFKGIPSRMGLLLDISPRILEKVLYFAAYIVIDPGFAPLSKNQILSEKEYRDMREKYEDDFDAGMGAEAVKKLLQQIDLEELSQQLRAELKDASGQKKARIVKRLEVVDAFRLSHNKPEWMIIDVLPVLPPEIRPMVPLDGGRYASSDLNDLYRRVINRNNRLKRLIQLNAPDIIVRNEKRMLQEAVDALIDNGRRGRAVTGANNRALKSLSDMLKGKQGRFRQNLLGKRVDYSGRSVIVVGPSLKIYQCGLPKEMAIELFRPFVMKKLVEDGLANNIKAAKKMVEKGEGAVWDALEFVIKEHPVMLNRAPTLHRLGIQAFEPVLVEGRAIKLHPLVCTAFNADFDGDQMAVHVPLSAEAQTEARVLMLSANNLLRPQDGGPVTIPSQDMILGAYYLTFTRDEEGTGHIFADKNEAMLAYDAGVVTLHSPIKVRIYKEIDGEMRHKLVETTVGRLIYNEAIPQDLGFVDRTDPEHMFDPEINFVVGKKQLGKIIDKCINKHGFTKSAGMLDAIKDLGYHYSTVGSLTVAIADMTVPAKKYELIAETEKEIIKIDRQYRRGLITNEERYRLSVAAWEKTTADVTVALQENMDRYNPIFMMADSGARGSMAQIRQLAGMRGLMADTAGRTIEIPIKANFREGLSVLEYFISSRGARKGMADTALRTADSGYLTRRLVDVSQEVIIREEDCGTTDGIDVAEIEEYGQVIETFAERIHGRYPSVDIVDPATGEVLITRDTMMRKDDAEKLEAHGIHSVKIRSVLTCRSRSGVCSKCYGINLAIGEPVGAGEAVGIIAAQSIGEPGTQLTMRTFHTGGVAGGDITQGLPRVEELFEARKPKKMAQLAEISGKVSIEETKRNVMCNLTITADDGEVVTYALPYSAGIKVKDGDTVPKGLELTEGALSPHEVLRIRGLSDCHNYLIREVQKVYRQQGVDTNDKHIEVIVRQMMRKVRVEEAGDSDLLSGSTIEITEFRDAEEAVKARIAAGEKNEMGEELRLPTCTRLLMGITKASLATESFLSAASFQETTKVLTEAAIKGKVDHLLGLKENVIIGKLIPAGSGLAQYRKDDPIDDEGNLPGMNVTSPSVVAEPLAEPTQEDADGADKDDDLFFEVGAMELEKPTESDQPQA